MLGLGRLKEYSIDLAVGMGEGDKHLRDTYCGADTFYAFGLP